jgi:hypothetical protein
MCCVAPHRSKRIPREEQQDTCFIDRANFDC